MNYINGILACLLITAPTWAVYDLPNINNGCPANCRQVPWNAGSDQWNGGTLPKYKAVNITGLVEGDGTTDNASAINAALSSIGNYEAAVIPPGIYYVNSSITIPSYKVLRGAGMDAPWLPSTSTGTTTIKLGSNGSIKIGTSYNRGSARAISSGFTKGSQTLVMASGHGFSSGDWIMIQERADSEIPVNPTGNGSKCNWCGDNDGTNFLNQFVKITQVSQNTITINRPMYYTFKSGLNPHARSIAFTAIQAGIEDLKIHGWSDINGPLIGVNGALYSWVKNVETYNAGAASKEAHVRLYYSHGVEIRDSYFHAGRNSSSDRNYGVALFWANSDHKIENNILRHHRHSINFEGGGSGVVVLGNYVDDNYTDDLSYLGSARANHGAHPYMNLYEGNIISHITADHYWGTSSHNVFFRNWLWGDETGTGVPSFPPNSGYVAIDVYGGNNFYSFVGNVLGNTELRTNWKNATLRSSNHNKWASPSAPVIYGFSTETASNTSINHGNYDYKTMGVAYWEGGTDHVLKNSMYYASKPSWWCSDLPWPAMGPDVNGITNDIPAKLRYERKQCSIEEPVVVPYIHGVGQELFTVTGADNTLKISLKQPKDVTVLVYNLNGKQVKSVHIGKLEAGMHQVSISTEEIPSGIYMCQLQSGLAKSQTVKLWLSRRGK